MASHTSNRGMPRLQQNHERAIAFESNARQIEHAHNDQHQADRAVTTREEQSASQHIPMSMPNQAKPPSRNSTKVTHPRPYELYLWSWRNSKAMFPVLVLSWDDLNAYTILGHREYARFLSEGPECYHISEDGETARWAEGYEDGGPLVKQRMFPVMCFDEARTVGWLRAKNLVPFPFKAGESEGIYRCDEAKDVYARAQGYRSYKELEMKRRPESLGIWKVIPGQRVVPSLPALIWRTLRAGAAALGSCFGNVLATYEHYLDIVSGASY